MVLLHMAYTSVSFIIEKMKMEQIFDPELAIRIVRRNRKQFMHDEVRTIFNKVLSEMINFRIYITEILIIHVKINFA